jgi:anti-sigma B factor antagonist
MSDLTLEEGLHIRHRELADWELVSCRGMLGADEAPVLREAISQAQSRNTKVVVELRDAHVLDSACLAVLVGALRTAHSNGGELRLVMEGQYLEKVFEVTGLTKVFSIHSSVSAALHAA